MSNTKESFEEFYKKQGEQKQEGCPCGAFGKCCDMPVIYTPDHECSGEKVCEDCYQLKCEHCGASCYHEL